MPNEACSGRIETRDIDQYQLATPPWDVVLRQMSPGQFIGQTEFLQVNGILLYREHWTRRVMATGVTPAVFFMFGGPSSPRTRIDWCGAELNPHCLAFGAPSSEVDFVIPEDSHHVVLLVPNGLLRRYLGEDLATVVLKEGHFMGCEPGYGNALLDMLDRIIDKYLDRSDLLADARVCRAIEWQLLGTPMELLITNSPDAGCLPPRKRRLAVRCAIAYSDKLKSPASISQLAEAAGVSQRVLEIGFREAMDVTPREFLRWNRMNRVRKELAAAKGGISSVTQVATRWGFSELGRFAAEYIQLFSENPSTTLARNPRSCPRRPSDTLPERSSR